MIDYTVKVYSDGSGSNFWYLNDKLHREDGPAIEWANGIKFWYLNDKRHREDGPAIEYADGDKSWYLNGIKITEQEHQQRTNPAKELTVAEIEALLGHKVKIVK